MITVFDSFVGPVGWMTRNLVTGKVWGLSSGTPLPRELREYDPSTSPPTLGTQITLDTESPNTVRASFPRNLIIRNNIAWYVGITALHRVDLVTGAKLKTTMGGVDPGVIGFAFPPDAQDKIWVLYEEDLGGVGPLKFVLVNPTTLGQDTPVQVSTSSEPTNCISHSKTQVYIYAWSGSPVRMRLRVYDQNNTTHVLEVDTDIGSAGKFGHHWMHHDQDGFLWLWSGLAAATRVRKLHEATLAQEFEIDRGNIAFSGVALVAGKAYLADQSAKKLTRYNRTTGAFEDETVILPDPPMSIMHDFTHAWTGTFIIAGDLVVRFAEAQPTTLTITKTGTGTGTVTSSPAGIACGVTCSGPFTASTSVTLTPTPDVGSRFVQWTGDITSTDDPLTFSITDDTDLTAEFEVIPGFEACPAVPTSPGLGACAAVPVSSGFGACPPVPGP